jgi:hypothetical protein
VVVPIRDGAAGGGDEVSLLRASEGVAIANLALMAYHGIHAAFRKAGADRHNGVATHVEGVTDLSQTPAFSQFEQDLSACASTGALVAQVNKGLQA